MASKGLSFHKKNSALEYFKLYAHYAKTYGKIALWYQLGSFHNIFGIDNGDEVVGNLPQVCNDLGLRITRANKRILQNSLSNPLQGGFPSEKLDHYVKKCVDLGYTAIVYSQRDAIKNGKRRKERVLDRIVSPGTYIDEIPTADPVNLACVYVESAAAGKNLDVSVVILDLSTGKCFLHSIIEPLADSAKIASRVIYGANPKEVLLVRIPKDFETALELDEDNLSIHRIENVSKDAFKIEYQDELLRTIFPACGEALSPVEYLNLERNPSLVVALITILNFAHGHREGIANLITKPEIVHHRSEMYVSHHTMRSFNVIDVEGRRAKSLFDIVNFSKTPMGRREIARRLTAPIVRSDLLEKRYEEVESCLSSENLDEVSDALSGIGDIERMHRKIFLKRLEPAEIAQLDASYVSLWKVMQSFSAVRPTDRLKKAFKTFVAFYRKKLDLDKCAKHNLADADIPLFVSSVYPELDDTYERYSTAWDDLKAYAKDLSREIEEGREDLVRITHTNSEGYVLSLTPARFKILLERHPGLEAKRLSNSIKIQDAKIRELSNAIVYGKDNIIKANSNAFIELEISISERFKGVMDALVRYAAHADAVFCAGSCAMRYNYSRPRIDSSLGRSFIRAESLRHPIVERLDTGKDYIPNDVSIGCDGKNGYLIYGINGSGKSLYLKQIGLAIILAQSGFYVPADRFEFFPFKNLITKIGKRDDMYRNKSEFGCEIDDMRDMFDKASPSTLILADELCSGTTTNDAISLVSAAIAELANTETAFLFTSHLHQLKNIPLVAGSSIEMRHLEASVSDNEYVFGRRLLPGPGPDNYGVEIAKKLKLGGENFIANALATRRFLSNESNEIVPSKRSRYNSSVIMKACERCGSTTDLITHHKQHQAWADENGMIDGLHKNRRANLEVLCETCHHLHDHQGDIKRDLKREDKDRNEEDEIEI